jgi:Metallo-peptidase family M12B Reprolysin-like
MTARPLLLAAAAFLTLGTLGVARTARAAPEVVVEDPTNKIPEAQRALVRQATETVLERLPATDVARCSFRNAWRGKPTSRDWEKQMGFLRQQDRIVVTVLPEKLEKPILGMATVGSARQGGPKGRWTLVTIRLNQETLAYWAPGSAMDLDLWINAVAHEIGHTFGLRHGSGGGGPDWEGTYAGYFVTELGFCVASDGRTGSDRGDLDLRRKRKDRFGPQVWF